MNVPDILVLRSEPPLNGAGKKACIAGRDILNLASSFLKG
jgi:hypothetical protein